MLVASPGGDISVAYVIARELRRRFSQVTASGECGARPTKNALQALSRDPALGEFLLRELEGLWKYRVRRFRIVYSVDRSQRIVRIFAVGHRRSIYEVVGALVHGQP